MFSQCYSKTKSEYNVIILAGGAGSRMGDQSDYIPKALTKLGNGRVIDFIINRFAPICHKFIIGLGYHSDILQAYIKGSHTTLPIEFSYENPNNLLNNAYSTVYCLDKCDSRYKTIVVFCDLLVLHNTEIIPNSILLASCSTQGILGTFRHTVDDKDNLKIKLNTPPVSIIDNNYYGVMGQFVFSDTPLLKKIAYTNYYKLNDLTDDIVIPYNNELKMTGDICLKCFEFGTKEDVMKVRELWEN